MYGCVCVCAFITEIALHYYVPPRLRLRTSATFTHLLSCAAAAAAAARNLIPSTLWSMLPSGFSILVWRGCANLNTNLTFCVLVLRYFRCISVALPRRLVHLYILLRDFSWFLLPWDYCVCVGVFNDFCCCFFGNILYTFACLPCLLASESTWAPGCRWGASLMQINEYVTTYVQHSTLLPPATRFCVCFVQFLSFCLSSGVIHSAPKHLRDID